MSTLKRGSYHINENKIHAVQTYTRLSTNIHVYFLDISIDMIYTYYPNMSIDFRQQRNLSIIDYREG